jgi:Protein of unknown function (DUF3048) N-terminal domain/Protein of unknown function (DUF3048) C-terminal domain
VLTAVVALTLVSACSSDPNRSIIAAPVTVVAETTAVERTTVPTTTTPPTTELTTAPPTTRPAATTTSAPAASSTQAPQSEAPVAQDPIPTWPHYDPLPGVPEVDALTNVFHPELENVAALAVKIDNHPEARPQWALSLADVIFEENVESLTRFIAIFHSRLPDVIGPIRSARTSDMNILAAFNRPVLAWSGGNKYVTATVQSAASSGILVNVSAQTIGRCYSRAPGRKVPHNLVINPGCALEEAPSAGPARAPWTFDDAYLPQGAVDEAFVVPMDGVAIAWVWDAATGQYLRQQDSRWHVAIDGSQIAATNLVIMSVTYIPSLADPRSPEAQTLGSGQVVVHRNGVAVVGTWSRATATDPFVFTDAAGALIPMASGTTFVELVRA